MLLPIAVEFELGHHPVLPAFLVFALYDLPERALSFTLKSPFLNCLNHVSHVLINGANDDFLQPFPFDYIRKAMCAANVLFQAQTST
jgi:hypothetical protein